jgi:hypothetical protein
MLHKKIEKLYTDGTLFRNYIEGTRTFPWTFKLKRITQKSIQQHFDLLRQELKQLNALPLTVSYETFHFKTLGTQQLPVSVTIEDEARFFEMVGHQDSYDTFKKAYDYIIEQYPSLKTLFMTKPFLVLDHAKEWERLLRIVNYLLTHPDCNLYIRQITLKDIDTKFIEHHKKIIDLLLSHLQNQNTLGTLSDYAFEKRYGLKYPLPIIRARIFEKNCQAEDISLDTATFNHIDFDCQNVFIVENLTTFLTFPYMKHSIVIFGSGYAVSRLKDITWLKAKKLFYWGDIDIDGFAILSQLRGYFPHTRSFLMDEETLLRFEERGGTYTHSKTIPILDNLTSEEEEVYTLLKAKKGFRLEQEQLPFTYIQKIISSL